MSTRVIIVRHGQSSYNAQQRIQGRCDESVITDQGRADARIVGQTLSNLTFDAIYCSPLQRAQQTAEVIRNGFAVAPSLQSVDTLREVDLPLWEKLTKQEVKNRFPEDYRCWKERPEEFKMQLASGEEHFPVRALYEQAQQFWQEILPRHENQTILIVAHNGINRCLLMSAVGIAPAFYHSLQQSNCCINVLNFQGGWGDRVEIESLNQTAHLGVAIPSRRPGEGGLRLLLVRHGETDWNRASRFQGTQDIPLNDNGRAQSERAAAFLKDVKLDFALSSPLLRPKETAQIILQYHPGVGLTTNPELVEIGHGLWEGKLKAEVEAEFPGMLQQWHERPETVQMPAGENLQQVWERAIAAWEELVVGESETAGKTGLVVAHDAVNKVILCHLLGLTPAHIWSIKQGNGAVTVIDYPKGTKGLPVLQALNITSHLQGGILDRTAAGAL
ncbi:MAG: histidine phosphatase family protein [Chloroflexaceae bacterium]|nr:histidine phosphatase family protein [Chloroflexaceae bacterium]